MLIEVNMPASILSIRAPRSCSLSTSRNSHPPLCHTTVKEQRNTTSSYTSINRSVTHGTFFSHLSPLPPNQCLLFFYSYCFHPSIPNILPPCFTITIIIIRRRRAMKASHLSHGTSPLACNAGFTKSSTLTQRAW